MRILSIHGKNLASLAGEFSLDFREGPLADAGIFAITGPTGAGKSTLLDAMCLALFDSLPRLDSAPRSGASTQDGLLPSDPRGILRHGTGDGYAALEFVGRDGHSYRSQWSVQRARKRPDGALQASRMELTCLDAHPALPDKKKEIKEYILNQIGLNAQQFGRAVVLAQGEFEAFIKAPGDERALLLEKLTGTALYTRIGQLAFEKASAVKKAYQAIEQQIAAKSCLAPTARAELEAHHKTAQDSLTTSEVHLKNLQTQQEWHTNRILHATRLEEAHKTLTAAKIEQDNAAPRRDALARNQQALALAEIWRNSLAAKQTHEEAKTAAEQARIAEQAARDTVQAARQTLTEAENHLTQAQQRQTEAAPKLAAARAVDQALATARQANTTAREKHTTCEAESRDTHQQAEQATAALTNATNLKADLQAWLNEHQPLERLTHDEHDITDRLTARHELEQGILTLQHTLATQEKELDLAQAAMKTAQQDCTAAQTSLQQATQVLHAARECAPTTQQSDALHAEYDALSKIEQDNASLQKDLSLLHQSRQEYKNILVDLARLTQEQQTRQQARENAEQALPEQRLRAEEKRKAATRLSAATDGTARLLREALTPGEPCPVCGATEHHLASLTTVLDEAVEQARTEATAAEQALRTTEQTLADLTAADKAAQLPLARLEQQQKSLKQKLSEYETHCAQATTTLHQALCAQGETPAPDTEAQTLRLRTRLDSLTQQKTAMARAQEKAEEADKAERQARISYEEQRRLSDNAAERLRMAQTAHSTTQSDLTASTHKQEELTRFLANRLDRIAPDWQSQPNPSQWLAHKTAEWRDKNTRLRANETTLPELSARAAEARQADKTAQHQLEAAQQALKLAETQYSNLERERATLLDGQSVQAVETALATTIQTASAQEKIARNAHENANLFAAKASTQRQDSEHAVVTTQEKYTESQRRLDEHLTAASLSITDVERANNLGATALAVEADALRALETAIATAQATVATHQNLLNQHDTTRPTDPTPEGMSLEQAITLATAETEQAKTTVQDVLFRLRQDDEARSQTEKLHADLEQAQQQGKVWEDLNDLLGDAKGKILRGFAQNLTLDRLLGFANEKLADLKPRYTLQRAGGETADSAMLIEVVDNDMAGQTRGLHNLSGGERFLVSLSLALGLSEMSCGHGVRIESLFIDEGFGSLDSASLGQAIAVLEHLHAQGRRVGVISHVEELKERIPVKVEITPGASGRSTLSIMTD